MLILQITARDGNENLQTGSAWKIYKNTEELVADARCSPPKDRRAFAQNTKPTLLRPGSNR